jgi:hypothetical protein
MQHVTNAPVWPLCPRKLPTFLYAMPFSDTRIFLEETSLVARPAVPFEELKQVPLTAYLSFAPALTNGRRYCS